MRVSIVALLMAVTSASYAGTVQNPDGSTTVEEVEIIGRQGPSGYFAPFATTPEDNSHLNAAIDGDGSFTKNFSKTVAPASPKPGYRPVNSASAQALRKAVSRKPASVKKRGLSAK